MGTCLHRATVAESLKFLGANLAASECVGYVNTGSQECSVTVLYTKNRPDAEHVHFQPGGVLLYSSEILKSRCELNDVGCGTRTSWSCEKKGFGRLYARCSLAEHAAKRRGEGKRARLSMRVGCNAMVTAVLAI